MSNRRATAPSPLTAYVLHSHAWSETSLIVELFTRERGRVVVAAKGAKRPFSQLRAVLMPFQRINVLLGKAPVDEANEVHNLRSAEWGGGVPTAGGGALFAGFYVNELLLKLLARQDAHAALFDAYGETLMALSATDDTATQTALRAFELSLLRGLGWLPELSAVTQTAQPVQAQHHYTLHEDRGLVNAASGGVSGSTMLAIEAALTLGHGAALRHAVAPAMVALRAPLRHLLHYHLGGTPLRTRRVMQDIHKFLAKPRPFDQNDSP